MKGILAVNNLGYIGLNSGLPWHCKSDFQHFKRLTENSTLLVGYNTFQTLPELKGRTVILDRREDFQGVFKSQELIDWCIGGRRTYEKYASYFTELHISHIDNNSIGDTLFPDLRHLSPNCLIYNYYFKGDKIFRLEEVKFG
jgi:dihydrofolate reductase